MAEKVYIERSEALEAIRNSDSLHRAYINLARVRYADVRPVVVCAECQHNNACLTQAFVDDCGKMPLDRSTFFCADGKKREES